ncbi:hypothetical protein DL96DRAFT_817162 [Flagelloscypha sp. PMI_526]|nr:hypothetical protein DL96DRAFT_817162 [Flagelloscypha sp. PMI_526]
MYNEKVRFDGACGDDHPTAATLGRNLHDLFTNPTKLFAPEESAMPLPDERPRSSVANLIGRFEQTQKRQSLTFTGGTGARSSSVQSHNTGDSAKEEAAVRREWPPPSSESKSPSAPLPLPPKNQSQSPNMNQNQNQSRSQNQSQKYPSLWRNQSQNLPLPAQPNLVPLAARASAAAASTPVKKQPVRPTSTTPSARPKTPSKSSGTLSTPRPKTPSRAKTPTSGIYAPTAATRARTSEPPAPVKRATLSPEAAERLRNHTQASASKARDAAETKPTPVKSAAQRAREAAAANHAEKKGLIKKPPRQPLPSTLKSKQPTPKGTPTKKPTAAMPPAAVDESTSNGHTDEDAGTLSFTFSSTFFSFGRCRRSRASIRYPRQPCC